MAKGTLTANIAGASGSNGVVHTAYRLVSKKDGVEKISAVSKGSLAEVPPARNSESLQLFAVTREMM